MKTDTNGVVDLYVAAYPDPDAARGDWNAIASDRVRGP